MTLLTSQFGKICNYFDATRFDLTKQHSWRSCIHVAMTEVIGGRSNSPVAGITRQGFEQRDAVRSTIARHGGEHTQLADMQMQGYFSTEADAYHCARSIQTILRERRTRVPHHYIAASAGLSSGVCLRKTDESSAEYYGHSIGFASWLSGLDAGSEICASLTFFNRLGKNSPELQQDFIPASIVVKGYINPVSYFKLNTRESEHCYQWESDQ